VLDAGGLATLARLLSWLGGRGRGHLGKALEWERWADLAVTDRMDDT
jgi:hypothetical protein